MFIRKQYVNLFDIFQYPCALKKSREDMIHLYAKVYALRSFLTDSKFIYFGINCYRRSATLSDADDAQ